MARRAAFIAQQRERFDHLLLLDAGDSLLNDELQPLTIQSQSRLIVEAMNLMGYDAMALGEQDLKLGPTALRQRMAEADFSILSANVHLAGSKDLFGEPYAIVQLGPYSVGIIGLTGAPAAPPAGFEVTDPVAAAHTFIPQVAEQVDLLILLSHVGWAQNLQLAELSAELDLIISGGDEQASVYPYISAETGTYLAQAERPSRGHAGRNVGQWQLNLGDQGVMMGEWQIVPLGPEFISDPEMLALIQRYQQQ